MYRIMRARWRLRHKAEVQRAFRIKLQVAHQVPFVTIARAVKRDYIRRFGYLVKNKVLADRNRVTIVGNIVGHHAHYTMDSGIILLETKLYPMQRVGLQYDRTPIPFISK